MSNVGKTSAPRCDLVGERSAPMPIMRFMPDDFQGVARRLTEIGRRFDARGWVLGTSGNFSAVVSRNPLQLAITPSAASKGELEADQFLAIDGTGAVIGAAHQRPSAETALHLEIVHSRPAGAVLHTHSIWSTLVSDRYAADGGLWIEGFEMLKGLEGVTTHEHREWVPVVANDQDMTRLAGQVRRLLSEHPNAHGFLLHRHGLYTWGENLAQATRHVEILEFLLEIIGRKELNQ